MSDSELAVVSLDSFPAPALITRASPTTRKGFLRVLYPYHPLSKQVLEVFGSAGGQRDLMYVRMPNNATRGIPAWMFDEAICGSVRNADSPLINCHALFNLARLLDGHSKESQPLLEQIKASIQAARIGALPKSALAKACDYTLTLWSRLSCFLEYPELESSNNKLHG
jgi:hypothetical protein